MVSAISNFVLVCCFCYKTEKATVNYEVHRPAGILTVWVERGRNLRSPELGLPANVSCRVSWDPVRYMPEKKLERAAKIDKALGSTHEIGATKQMYTANPEWKFLSESDVAKRLKHLLPRDGGGFFDTAEDNTSYVDFPVLQPLKVDHNDLLSLMSWSKSPAAVVFEVKYNDALSLLPGSENTLGEVTIPFSKLTECGEIAGWFKVLESGTKRLVAVGSDETTTNGNGDAASITDDDPQVFVRAKWTVPKPPKEGQKESETEREASLVVQEEMIRSAVSNQIRKVGLVGSSLGALNTVRGLSDNLLMVQNTLGWIFDIIGTIRSAFNFSVRSQCRECLPINLIIICSHSC